MDEQNRASVAAPGDPGPARDSPAEPARVSPDGSATPETPLAYRAVRGGLWVIGSSYWTIGFGFAATLILTRLLSPEAFGEFALALFFVQLLRVQPKLGLGYAFAQYKGADGQAIGTYVIADGLAALAGLFITLLAMPFLSRFGFSATVVQVTLLLAVASLAEGLMGIGTTFLEKELRFGPTTLIPSIVFPLSYIPAFWLALHEGGVWSLVAQNLTYNILFMLGIWWVVRWRLPQIWRVHWQFSPALVRRFLRFGVTVGLALLAGTLLTQLDNFYIGTFVGVTVLGFYDRAYRTAQWPSTLLNSLISRAAFYTYARLQDDLARLQKTVTMMLWVITTLALPIALIIFVSAPDLVRLLYGDRWLPSALFLRILVVYAVMRPMWENGGTLFIALGKPRLTTTFTVMQALVLAILGLPLTLAWGALGTCVAVGLAFLLGTVLVYRSLLRQVPLKLWSILGTPVVASLLVLIGYLVINRTTGIDDLPLVVRVAWKALYAGGGFFLLILLLQPRVTRERAVYVYRLVRGER